MGKRARKANREQNKEARQFEELKERAIDNTAVSLADQMKAAQAEAAIEGKYGVALIEFKIVRISPKVPFGKIFYAGSEEALAKLPDVE